MNGMFDFMHALDMYISWKILESKSSHDDEHKQSVSKSCREFEWKVRDALKALLDEKSDHIKLLGSQLVVGMRLRLRVQCLRKESTEKIEIGTSAVVVEIGGKAMIRIDGGIELEIKSEKDYSRIFEITNQEK